MGEFVSIVREGMGRVYLDSLRRNGEGLDGWIEREWGVFV